MKVKVKGRLKEMKRKEFKSDCLLGILILLILLHYIFQFLFVFALYLSGFFNFLSSFTLFFCILCITFFFENVIYKSSSVGPLIFFLGLYLVPASDLSGDLS